MKIAKREYYCPMCKQKEMVSTNHQGEIYSPCKGCGSCVRYCAEIDSFAGLPYRTATFRAYRLFLEGSYLVPAREQRMHYTDLTRHLTGKGYTVFKVLMTHAGSEVEKTYDGETVRLYHFDQWTDQFVSNIGRLHYWKEYVFPNKNIKAGYYLEIHDEAKSGDQGSVQQAGPEQQAEGR